MGRRSSGGKSARPAASRNPPPKKGNPAPAQNGGGSMLGNIGSVIAEGFAFGTGSSIAHRAVDAVMGPRTFQHEVGQSSVPAPAPAASSMGDSCSLHMKAFQDCVNSNGSDIGKCQFYIDMLTECRRSSGSMTSS